ncbi:hypothetical protein ATK36_6211 [Amycolatopsis sulphurea]|uniref:Uncharacterized protein n=1 Tax=Amycolatopsis sulphurea TaxID=76022 RepID=A0A2A9FJM7_9PSEU|nr:hypothetical protein [Amycolatopsis sulphurea]PFG50951.1 hypothetical protein ATK36_6211 [Amycolatopsis sulphurea]
MYVIPVTATMQRWSVSIEAGKAVFACAPAVEDHTAARVLPRMWPGHGLGVLGADVPGLLASVGEVMKAPLYWISRYDGARAWDTQPWTVVREDPDDGFVYVGGPCGPADSSVGYRPVYHLPVALTDVRGLRIRLGAYLRAASRV